ncbi:MAG: SGNH/GDSL hydrolase family protein [bacterium]
MIKCKLKLFFLVAAGICAGLGMMEIGMRMFPPAYLMGFIGGKFFRYDRILGWDGLENKDGYLKNKDVRHHACLNRYGYRGNSYEFQRNEKKRIMFLGDSFVWGTGVDDLDIFTSLMERRSDKSPEIINLGVMGYGTDQEYLLWLKKGILWKPDAAILMIHPSTDICDNLYPERYGYPKPVFRKGPDGRLVLLNVPVPRKLAPWSYSPQSVSAGQPEWARILLNHSMAVNLFMKAACNNNAIQNYLEKRKIIPSRLSECDRKHLVYSKRLDQKQAAAWELMFSLVEKLRASAEKSGSRFCVCIAPSVEQVYPEMRRQLLRNPVFMPHVGNLDSDAPNRRIIAWCRKKNIHVIDLLPDLRKAGMSDPYLYFPINRHWTAGGHAVVAETLSKDSWLFK